MATSKPPAFNPHIGEHDPMNYFNIDEGNDPSDIMDMPQSDVLSVRDGDIVSMRTLAIEEEIKVITRPTPPPLPRSRLTPPPLPRIERPKRSSTMPPPMLSSDKAEMLKNQRMELINGAIIFFETILGDLDPETRSQLSEHLENTSRREDFGACFNVIMDERNRKICGSASDIVEFIKAIERKGPKAGEALQDARIIYAYDKQTYDRMVELAQIRGGASVKALLIGWPVFSKNSRIFATFLDMASKGTNTDIESLVEASLAAYPPEQGSPDAFQLKRIATLIQDHGAEIGKIVVAAKQISSEIAKTQNRSNTLSNRPSTNDNPTPPDEILDLFLTLMEKKQDIKSGQLLAKAAEIYQNDLKKMEIIADLIAHSDPETVEAVFASLELYGDENYKLKKLADVARKCGPIVCGAAESIRQLWDIDELSFDASMDCLSNSNPETLQEVAKMDQKVVAFMGEIIRAMLKEPTESPTSS